MKNETLLQILEQAKTYPSPHNSQPIKVRFTNNSETIEVYYNLDKGLPAESYGVQFGYVCTGVYLACLQVVAAKYGFKAQIDLRMQDMDFNAANRNHLMAVVRFEQAESSQVDIANFDAYLRRQTSRIPYDNKLVDEQAIADVKAVSQNRGYEFNFSSDQKVVADIIDINQRTLFLDLANDAVYAELMAWLRFSEHEAKTKADGLSAKTMLINGGVLKFMMKHRGLWHAPIMGNIVKKVYLNTMRGVRQVGWLTGPFATNEDYVHAGQCFLHVWLEFTKHNVYLHPYGTVITNPISHKAFIERIGELEQNGSMAWMLFRFGYSKKPPVSYRRELSEMIIKD